MRWQTPPSTGTVAEVKRFTSLDVRDEHECILHGTARQAGWLAAAQALYHTLDRSSKGQ